ncbi:MAG: N-acetylmuramic acid 6-phosphate etherase [Vicinamibacteria bacterium]|nr:N-acetylmuramic acid 6-phosphate etherase [Vicinamibacteria bacterium]
MKAKAPADRWSRLLTESRNPRSRRLDTMSTAGVVGLLLDEDRRALLAAAKAQRAIARAADLAAGALSEGGRVVFLGAGTSGRLAILEAAECPPTFGTDPERIVGIMAGGQAAVFRAVEGAEDRGEDGVAAVSSLGPRDLLCGISASSVTPFVHGALAAARARGARTVLVTCAPGRGLSKLADVAVVMATGPEVLTGSTRLKAGSATKAALNAITTAAMVKLGKAYENLMVDLRQNSAKLVSRARRIVSIAGGVDAERAAELLDAAGGEAKTAIVMARLGLDAAAARERLATAGGHVRRALASRRPPRR